MQSIDQHAPYDYSLLAQVAAACPALRFLWLPYIGPRYQLDDLRMLGRRCRRLESLVLSPGGLELSQSLAWPPAGPVVDPQGWVARHRDWPCDGGLNAALDVGEPLSFPRLRALALAVTTPSFALNCPQLVELAVNGVARKYPH